MSVDTLYTQITQWEIISGLLDSTLLGDQYIDPTIDYYLARRHHSAKDDYVDGSQQRATFHFVNIAPQWQTFNGGNWEALESSVRAYADKKKLDLVVYTGTYGLQHCQMLMELRPNCIYMSTATITKRFLYQNCFGKLCTIARAKLALSLWETTIHMFLTRREIILSVMMSAQKFLG